MLSSIWWHKVALMAFPRADTIREYLGGSYGAIELEMCYHNLNPGCWSLLFQFIKPVSETQVLKLWGLSTRVKQFWDIGSHKRPNLFVFRIFYGNIQSYYCVHLEKRCGIWENMSEYINVSPFSVHHDPNPQMPPYLYSITCLPYILDLNKCQIQRW
jgi:hypothetical protein